MITEKNPAVAAYFARIGELDDERALAAATAGLLENAGWVQGHNAVDANGVEVGSQARDAARFSVSSAIIRTSHETGLDRTMAVKKTLDRLAEHIRASHPDAAAFEAEESETRPTVRNLSVAIAWNDHPGQTVAEMVRTLRDLYEVQTEPTTSAGTSARGTRNDFSTPRTEHEQPPAEPTTTEVGADATHSDDTADADDSGTAAPIRDEPAGTCERETRNEPRSPATAGITEAAGALPGAPADTPGETPAPVATSSGAQTGHGTPRPAAQQTSGERGRDDPDHREPVPGQLF